MVPKHRRETQLDDQRMMESLRERVKAIQVSEGASVARDVAKVKAEFASAKSAIPEAATRATSGIKLDFSLEKGRIRDEERKLAAQITAAHSRMEAQVAELRGKVHSIRKDVDDGLVALIGMAVSVFFIWKVFTVRSEVLKANGNGNGNGKLVE